MTPAQLDVRYSLLALTKQEHGRTVSASLANFAAAWVLASLRLRRQRRTGRSRRRAVIRQHCVGKPALRRAAIIAVHVGEVAHRLRDRLFRRQVIGQHWNAAVDSSDVMTGGGFDVADDMVETRIPVLASFGSLPGYFAALAAWSSGEWFQIVRG